MKTSKFAFEIIWPLKSKETIWFPSGFQDTDVSEISTSYEYFNQLKAGNPPKIVFVFLESFSSKSVLQLEPSCCKKRQKKSQPRNWFGE